MSLCLFLVKKVPSHGLELSRLETGDATVEEATDKVGEWVVGLQRERITWHGRFFLEVSGSQEQSVVHLNKERSPFEWIGIQMDTNGIESYWAGIGFILSSKPPIVKKHVWHCCM